MVPTSRVLRSHTKTGSNFNGRKRAINKKKSGNTGSKETEKRRRTEENHEITEIPYVNQHKENENIEREWLEKYKRNMVERKQEEENRIFGITRSRTEFIMKNLPTFGGKSSEYLGWERNARMLFEKYGQQLDDSDKLSIIFLKLSGVASEIAANAPSTHTYSDIFQLLNLTYGRSEHSIIASCPQKQNEPLQEYCARLQSNMTTLGIESKIIQMEYFINGLLGGYREKIRNLYPISLAQALQIAVKIEAEESSSGRRTNYKVNHISEYPGKQIDNNMTTNRREINSLKHELAAVRHENDRYKQKQPGQTVFYGTCFACKAPGHPFFKCPTAPPDIIQNIRDNYKEYVDELRAERKQNVPLNH